MAGIAWVNGTLLPPEQAAISPVDRGFLYGEGLFETMRAYRGRVFRLSQHLDRLFAGADELDLTPPPRDDITRAVEEALTAGGLADASLIASSSFNARADRQIQPPPGQRVTPAIRPDYSCGPAARGGARAACPAEGGRATNSAFGGSGGASVNNVG